MQSLYRRPLPEPLIPFSSPLGRNLFREALDAGTLEAYFPLSEQFHTQSDPAFCGLSSLVMALNALSIDPGRLWKGPWRWFGEELLDCCRPLESVRQFGITLSQLACLARCNGAEATIQYADEHSAEAFRKVVEESSRSKAGVVVIASYSRTVLGQTGEGHFSPIGGYHTESDLALVLDVARFKYPPHWVPLPLLHEAMCAHDGDARRARGWMTLRALSRPSSLSYLVSCRDPGWNEFLTIFFSQAPGTLEQSAPETAEKALMQLTQLCVSAGLTRMVEMRDVGSDEHAAAANALRAAVRATRVYQAIYQALEDERAELVTILSLAAPKQVWCRLPATTQSELATWFETATEEPTLRAEIAHVARQIGELVREPRV